MKQSLDNIFRDHLGSYEKSLPANAWNRIEDNLKRKNAVRARNLSIAAAIFLVASFSIVFLSVQPKNKTTESIVIENKQSPIGQVPIINETTADPEEVSATNPSKAGRIMEKPAKVNSQNPIPVREVASEVTPVTLPEAPPLVADLQLQKSQEEEVSGQKMRSPQKVYFDPHVINDKYLRPSVNEKSVAEQTMTPDLKAVPFSLGQLRQWKNDLLALDFKPGHHPVKPN